jgi:hypothetical protein
MHGQLGQHLSELVELERSQWRSDKGLAASVQCPTCSLPLHQVARATTGPGTGAEEQREVEPLELAVNPEPPASTPGGLTFSCCGACHSRLQNSHVQWYTSKEPPKQHCYPTTG